MTSLSVLPKYFAFQGITMAPQAQLVPDIRLCSGIYQPTAAGLPAVEVICQAVVLNAVAYVWIDGVDAQNPLLLPVQVLHGFRSRGTLREYLEDEKHIGLGEQFDMLMDLCMERRESATVLVRACEIMHAEGLPADHAIATAHQWGLVLTELDLAERAAYRLVGSGIVGSRVNATEAVEAAAAAFH
jgi:hypothetical protein